MNELIDPEQLERTAFHESGHAAMAYMLGRRAGLVSVRPGAHHAGISFHGPSAKVPKEMIDRHLGHPVPLLPAKLRRWIETTILISLAGDEAAFLPWYRSPEKAGYRPETADDEAAAEGLARELVSLSRTERETLDEAERSEHSSDEDKVWLFANAAVGEPYEAGVYLGWLRVLTRNLIWSTRCLRLIDALVPELISHEVLPARAVRAIFLMADDRKPRTAPGLAVAAQTK